ncbi:MAG: hypothetical protein KGH76_06320 [Thaumarchaeota archaeon]|nr:hypothetical protein [Nitrososphaerota archaeon]
MSKKILVFAVLFSLVISMALTQEANALTRGSGQYSRTTASLDPSRVCGVHICQPGENTKWSSAVLASQRQGPGKATGGQYGNIIMNQVVVNTWTKNASVGQNMAPNSSTPEKNQMPVKMMPPVQQNNTKTVIGSNSTIAANNMNSTIPQSNTGTGSTAKQNSTNTNSTMSQ